MNTRYYQNTTLICCIVLLFITNSSLYAQIIYTDIPDVTPNATYSLDLNNDGNSDFLIQFELINKILCIPQHNNAYAGNVVAGTHLPYALPTSTTICDTLATWFDSNSPGTMAFGTNIGYWVGVSDRYIPLKIVVGTNTYYGWARLDVLPTSTSFTIKDYAYESTPNTCIETGSGIVGVDENSTRNNFSISQNPFMSSTTIQTSQHLNDATLTIYNTYGQIVKKVKNIVGNTISLSRDALPSGLYCITLMEKNQHPIIAKLTITD